MESKFVICMTGFSQDPKQPEYEKKINQLKCIYSSKLISQTNILIVNDVGTEKHKIARLYSPPIDCVTISWLLDSHFKNKILGTKNYTVKSLLYGMFIAVFGFKKQKTESIIKVIKEKGGKAEIMNNLQEWESEKFKGINAIMIQEDIQHKIKHKIDLIPLPIVKLKWLQDSINSKQKRVKYPTDYSINLYHLQKVPVQQRHFKRMQNKLKQLVQIKSFEIHPDSKTLQNCVIYVDENVGRQFAQMLRKLIAILGGYYLNFMFSGITHILTDSINEIQLQQFAKFGCLTNIIRVQWLIDTIYLHKKMDEEDYQIRSFKPKGTNYNTYNDPNATNQMSFANSMSIGTIPPSLIPLSGRKSISVKTEKKTQIIRKFQSQIFKNYKFYMDRTDPNFNEIHKKLTRNGGAVYQTINKKLKFVYFVMKDNSQNEKILDNLKIESQHDQIQPISPRWIDECIKEGRYIPHTTESYIFKPFPFRTPIFDFHKLFFEVFGIDEHRSKIRQLLIVLGSTKIMPNKSELTHVLCGEKYKEVSRYTDIKNQNKKVKFVDWNWLLECGRQGTIVEADEFLLEEPQQLSPRSIKKNRPIDVINLEQSEQKIPSNSKTDGQE